jgi:putative endonuclease
VYYEQFQYIEDAIIREKQIKKWNREWKIRLIESNNPEWNDIYHGFTQPMMDSRLDRE